MLKPSTRALLQFFRQRREQVGKLTKLAEKCWQKRKSNKAFRKVLAESQAEARRKYGSRTIAGWLTQSKSALNLVDG